MPDINTSTTHAYKTDKYETGSLGKVSYCSQARAIVYNRTRFYRSYPLMLAIQLLMIPVFMLCYDNIFSVEKLFKLVKLSSVYIYMYVVNSRYIRIQGTE